jgi:hypothetical protein
METGNYVEKMLVDLDSGDKRQLEDEPAYGKYSQEAFLSNKERGYVTRRDGHVWALGNGQLWKRRWRRVVE